MDFQNDSRRFFDVAPDELKRRAAPTLRALEPGFHVSWFREQGTRIWYAVLKPKDWVRDRFGLLYEYVLVANHFDKDFHLRTLEVDLPDQVAYRVDRQLRFVASDAPGVEAICAAWARDEQVSVVVLTAGTESQFETGNARETLEELLAARLWVRDRFDDSEPVRSPGEFFGREALVNDILHRLADGHPIGLMGLRKIGKSSVLRRIEDRLLGSETYLAVTSFVSCNGADVKASHWSHLVARILKDWTTSLTRTAHHLEKPISLNKVRAVSNVLAKGRSLVDDGEVARALISDFNRLYKAASSLAGGDGRVRFVAFLDEADHLNPESDDALLWKDGFFSFWGTLQALKRDHDDRRALTWMLGGVNPGFLEAGSFDGRPNPLFETAVEFLRPMPESEASDLLNGLGKPMGLAFDDEAVGTIFAVTGGHPWLLRRAGSLVHRGLRDRTTAVSVGARECKRVLDRNKVKFFSHVDWILGHLASIAPDEHTLLQDLCVQGPTVYEEDWLDNEFRDVFAHHLEEYGLLTFEDDRPQVAMPLVQEAFQKRTSGGLGGQKRRLREAIDGLETAIRFRLRNDLQYPASLHPDDEPPSWRTPEETISLVVEAIPKAAGGRAKSREELRELGRANGLGALLEALNWDDYVLLVEKNFGQLRLKGNPGSVDEFVPRLRNEIGFFHVIRHNNDNELRAEIEQNGFDGCMRRILEVQAFFSD